MQYHQYSKLFTSGLLSDPSPAPSVPRPRPRRGRTLFLNSTAPGSPEPVDARTYSFLELADTLTSPVSPADPPIAWHSLGHSNISVAASSTPTENPGPAHMRKGVFRPAALTPISPFDTLPRLSIADQSFLTTDPSLPDSPTLDRRPTHKTAISVSATSTSLSVNSETKRVNRLVALACLEGRESSGRIPRKSQLNFMNMSDDEDEDDSFVSSPRISADRDVHKRSSTITASDISVLAILSSGKREVELLSPDSLVSQSPQTKPTSSDRPDIQMMEPLPPLSDLVDSMNDEDLPNWRSFIELSAPTA